MSRPKIRKRYETNDDILDDDGELPDEAYGERDEEWYEKFHEVENEESEL